MPCPDSLHRLLIFGKINQHENMYGVWIIMHMRAVRLRVPGGGGKSRVPEVVAEILNYCGNY